MPQSTVKNAGSKSASWSLLEAGIQHSQMNELKIKMVCKVVIKYLFAECCRIGFVIRTDSTAVLSPVKVISDSIDARVVWHGYPIIHFLSTAAFKEHYWLRFFRLHFHR